MKEGGTFWDGKQWVDEKSEELPYGLKLSELPAFAEKHGIPPGAEFGTDILYDENGPQVFLIWYVPAEDEGEAHD